MNMQLATKENGLWENEPTEFGNDLLWPCKWRCTGILKMEYQ